jgi:hypothetical protein
LRFSCSPCSSRCSHAACRMDRMGLVIRKRSLCTRPWVATERMIFFFLFGLFLLLCCRARCWHVHISNYYTNNYAYRGRSALKTR